MAVLRLFLKGCSNLIFLDNQKCPRAPNFGARLRGFRGFGAGFELGFEVLGPGFEDLWLGLEETAKPSSEAAKPSADTAKPRSETAKPRPAQGDSTFSSKPRPRPANPIYGDSAVLSKPDSQALEPGPPTPEPGPQTAKPSRDSRARGGSQEHFWCCAGLRGFGAKSSEIALNTGVPAPKLWSPSYLADFGQKSGFKK